MAIPLQVQNPINLQGNAPALQGSAQPLQGGTVQLQGAAPKQPFYPTPTGAPIPETPAKPVVATQRKTVAAAPVQAQAAPAPAMQPQILNFMNEKVGVGPNGNVLATSPIPQQQPPTPKDPSQQIAQYAGAAGLDPAGLATLLGLTPEERNGIYANLGINALADQVFSPPSQSTQQVYQTAYNSAGLSDIKSKFQALQDTINAKSQELNAAIGKVNENPWLSEASRIGRARNLQELAQGEIANLVSQAQQYADLYNQGLSEVERVVGYNTQDFQNNQQINAAKLQYLQQQAEQQIGDAQNAKLSRYMPDYLQAASASKKPETMTLEDGSIVVWNSSTRKFDTVYEGQNLKNQPASYQEYLLAKKDGFTGNYNDYQNMDANRKRSVSTTINMGGDYNSAQLKALTNLNNVVSKNATYSKTASMKAYANNVLAALDQGNGLSDIAAINQFQKVIDEGAVTRDQDVKLIQESQSLYNTLKTKIAKLEKGDQLGTEQRQQMEQLVNKMIEAQKNALTSDPYIQAKISEAKQYGLAIEDTILGELQSSEGYQSSNQQYDFNALSQQYGY